MMFNAATVMSVYSNNSALQVEAAFQNYVHRAVPDRHSREMTDAKGDESYSDVFICHGIPVILISCT